MMALESSGAGALLVVNAGSSSLKLAWYGNRPTLPRLCRVTVDRIGRTGTALDIELPSRPGVATSSIHAPDHRAALARALDEASRSLPFTVHAVGHRIVHGGAAHAAPERVTPGLLTDLHRLAALDPSHMPAALDAVDALAARYPAVPQIACFDTAFHRTLSTLAARYPLPSSTLTAGVRRYGFHGLSCEFIVSALKELDPATLGGRLLIAHLGNGASITAVQRGVSVDTTMGFSPSGGLMMGTRCGDLDPAVLIYLAGAKHGDLDAVRRLVNEESGLLGVSGLSSDIRDLLAARPSPPAVEAIELFCYTARKYMGALAAVLDGVDTIVFTGGIGEHAPTVRDGICRGLGHLGVELEPELNAANHDVISAPGSAAVVRVIATNEDLVIARHVRDLLA